MTVFTNLVQGGVASSDFSVRVGWVGRAGGTGGIVLFYSPNRKFVLCWLKTEIRLPFNVEK